MVLVGYPNGIIGRYLFYLHLAWHVLPTVFIFNALYRITFESELISGIQGSTYILLGHSMMTEIYWHVAVGGI